MMKGMAVLVVVVALALISVPSWAKGFENKKAAGKYDITLKADSYPLVKGNNTVTVSVADKAGKAVTNVKVKVRYYMPPMPGMAPMDYAVTPVRKGDAYAFTANIPMEGGWKVEVTVTPASGAEASATFNLDAR